MPHNAAPIPNGRFVLRETDHKNPAANGPSVTGDVHTVISITGTGASMALMTISAIHTRVAVKHTAKRNPNKPIETETANRRVPGGPDTFARAPCDDRYGLSSLVAGSKRTTSVSARGSCSSRPRAIDRHRRPRLPRRPTRYNRYRKVRRGRPPTADHLRQSS